jgi:hypothetical protein
VAAEDFLRLGRNWQAKWICGTLAIILRKPVYQVNKIPQASCNWLRRYTFVDVSSLP